MGLNSDIEDLDPMLREKARAFLKRLDEAGIAVRVTETERSRDVQRAYYSQGREPLGTVNALRKAAGLWPITAAENRYCITWTMESKHVDGLAFDIVPLDRWGKPWWGAPDSLWQRIGEIGEGCGLRWGGHWTDTPDRPHFEAPEED